MTLRILSAVALAVSAVACGGGGDAGGSPPERASVTFAYLAATVTDPSVAQTFPACVGNVGATHIHPSWRGFELVYMANGGDRWTISFDDVPAGTRQRIRVSDPNVCAENPTGAATRDVFANGVLLTLVVPTPGSGTEPGLAFTVAEDGTVTPWTSRPPLRRR